MINRLLGIVYTLLNKENVTATALAERYEVSVRTIYRDIEVLGQAGIPVYTRKGKNGGICLMEQFVLDKMMFTEVEQQACEPLKCLPQKQISHCFECNEYPCGQATVGYRQLEHKDISADDVTWAILPYVPNSIKNKEQNRGEYFQKVKVM